MNPNHAQLKTKQDIGSHRCFYLSQYVGPALFRQKRMGYRGNIYEVYKFRTMKLSATVGDEKEEAITKVADARITRLGQVLRKSRIDELPQAINILRGEMNWIGPGPEALVLSKWYKAELPFYRYRHTVRPGITGWAQVNQGHIAAVDDVGKASLWLLLHQKFSPWLGVLIVFRTVRTMLTGFGAR
ncbi:MAG: hypothetical protein E5V27_00165 [Mesorhizobium sp.]|nr:MAG: hypothetical protein E5V27_00165 [Mesorhizobium sp.]